MAKRKTISYRTTARMALGGGILSLAAALTQGVADVAALDLGVTWTVLSVVAILAWFVGAAAGVLALSTEYKRTAIAALVLCGLAIVVFVTSPLLAG
jgi:uncharacterized membrane protein YjfL (UPF0719 family)